MGKRSAEADISRPSFPTSSILRDCARRLLGAAHRAARADSEQTASIEDVGFHLCEQTFLYYQFWIDLVATDESPTFFFRLVTTYYFIGAVSCRRVLARLRSHETLCIFEVSVDGLYCRVDSVFLCRVRWHSQKL